MGVTGGTKPLLSPTPPPGWARTKGQRKGGMENPNQILGQVSPSWIISKALHSFPCGILQDASPDLFLYLYICFWQIFPPVGLVERDPRSTRSVTQGKGETAAGCGMTQVLPGTPASPLGEARRPLPLARREKKARGINPPFHQQFYRLLQTASEKLK